MISFAQPFCLLRPTNGRPDNQQMVDEKKSYPAEPSFSERWEIALSMNGLDNPKMAAMLGPHGHQNINGWKNRGHVGGPSERKVASLLAKTNMTWLQYGEGSPERFTVADESPLRGAERHSYAARIDPAIIRDVHTGLSWRFQVDLGTSYDLDRDADLFALAYAFSVSGAEMKEAVDARIVQLAGGIQSGKSEEAPRRARSGEPN
jgi:hypothetical protein